MLSVRSVVVLIAVLPSLKVRLTLILHTNFKQVSLATCRYLYHVKGYAVSSGADSEGALHVLPRSHLHDLRCSSAWIPACCGLSAICSFRPNTQPVSLVGSYTLSWLSFHSEKLRRGFACIQSRPYEASEWISVRNRSRCW